MGQAKKDLEEQFAKQAQQRKIIESKGYTYCVECDEPFISQEGSIICEGCWEEKINEK